LFLMIDRAACLVVFVALLGGCGGADEQGHKSEPPATVHQVSSETELARITLTETAERRLGISLAKVAKENVLRRRTLGGEMLVPAGRTIVVAAPTPGVIAAPQDGAIPLPGQRVQTGQVVLSLKPLLSPDRYVPSPAELVQMANARATLVAAQTVAQGDVDRSRVEAEAAQIALDRAKKLLADRAGPARAVDEAQAQLSVAESSLRAAEERARQLERLAATLDSGGGEQAEPLTLTAPQSGVIRNVAASPGQAVTAGATLFELFDPDVLWVRAPVYVGLLSEVETEAAAQIVDFDARRRFEPQPATPVAAPPSADSASSTADLYFQIENSGGEFRPGQRVGVELTLRGEQTGLVVPPAAILYDIYGGAWVYVKTADRTYERRRVAVSFTEDRRAVLAEGPAEGTEVVVDGAAELFGEEFGAGK
jgi:RND family efflux transporter MFP subunit